MITSLIYANSDSLKETLLIDPYSKMTWEIVDTGKEYREFTGGTPNRRRIKCCVGNALARDLVIVEIVFPSSPGDQEFYDYINMAPYNQMKYVVSMIRDEHPEYFI